MRGQSLRLNLEEGVLVGHNYAPEDLITPFTLRAWEEFKDGPLSRSVHFLIELHPDFESFFGMDVDGHFLFCFVEVVGSEDLDACHSTSPEVEVSDVDFEFCCISIE